MTTLLLFTISELFFWYFILNNLCLTDFALVEAEISNPGFESESLQVDLGKLPSDSLFAGQNMTGPIRGL